MSFVVAYQRTFPTPLQRGTEFNFHPSVVPPPGGMDDSCENPLLGGAEGASLRGGSSGSPQPTAAPLRWRGIIFIPGGAARGRHERLLCIQRYKLRYILPAGDSYRW